ncbi:MAG: ABC transporter permease [Candidatus Dormibacteraeota bacterium]|nr:ABC transporter permease [Candidatus Dormibacteraeota bacterium]
MVRAFRSEWIKIRRRSVLLGGAAMSFFAVVGVYFSITRATGVDNRSAELNPAHLQAADGLTSLLSRSADIIGVIALILVAAAVAAEYSQGTLRNLLVREPGRLRLLSGKFLALLLFCLIGATVACAVGTGVGFLVAPQHGLSTSQWTSSQGLSNLVALYGNLMLAIVAWSILGAFSAMVFRSAAAAVGVAIGYSLAAEALISQVWADGPKWLYGRLTSVVLSGGDPAISSYGRSLLIVGLYAVAMVLIGGVLFRRRDVSA